MDEKGSPSLLARLLPWQVMRRDWDQRARDDARHFIDCGHSGNDAAFWESGRKDLDLAVLRDVSLAPSARALEIGCGLGRLLRPLSERVETVYGVDVSGEMIKRAREVLASCPNVRLILTRGGLGSIPDASLDFVFSFIVFQHIPNKRIVRRYLREAARTLAGGGVFRLQVDGRPRPPRGRLDTWLGVWYAPQELRGELDRAGFEVVSLWGEHTHYLWATARRKSRPRRRDSDAVLVLPRAWRRDRLESFLARLQVDPSSEAEAVIFEKKSLRELAQRFLDSHESVSPESFVRGAYEVVLGREADPEGLAFYVNEIGDGIPRSHAIDCLLASWELEEQLRPVAVHER